jgi:hypothetical protein
MVERPQPKARTYDLDSTVGRRTLVADDVVSDRVRDRPAAGVRIGSLTGEVAEVWQARLPRHLFVPLAGA